ncbi:RNA exonuclease 4 [Paramuricea clavata]|uniref:RNA exonuclease 4 n=1 Tax=Paramuricea clavata TaxID=317549 RepID=A0A7D9ITT4_PARCT|nr:RNA exonuclease 4 [Paramuricea clavata]
MLMNFLQVLLLDHPRKRIRDTAKYKPFQEKVKTERPSLKKLAKEILSLSIQAGEHSSVEDARAAMKLYFTHRREWEKYIKKIDFRRLKLNLIRAVDIQMVNLE